MITKHSQTKYFVFDSTVADLGVAAGTLYSTATFLPTLPINGTAFYSPVAGSGNHNHSVEVPGTAFKVVQRRDTSGDNSPLYNKPWDESDWINATCANGVVINQIDAALGINDSHLVGSPGISDIVPADLTTYSLQVSGHGDRTELYSGNYNTPTTFGRYTTPDFSLGSLTTAQQRDTIVAELALDFNNKSKDMSFCVAIDSTGGEVGTGATLISSLGDGTVVVGTTVVLGYDMVGNIHSFVLTVDLQQAFLALDVRLTALGFAVAQLIPYVASASTNQPAGVVVAGTTNECDMFYFMALDEGKAMYDYRMATKRRIEVGLTAGFDSIPQERISAATEAEGHSHQLNIAYREHNMYEQHHVARMPYNSYNVEFPNTIVAGAYYDYFIIEHCDARTATSGMPNLNSFTTIIAVANFTVGTGTDENPLWTGVANAQRDHVIQTLNSFNTTNSLGNPALS